ncbi:Ion-translocating oxidoreductase complex subunit B [subsurface metagenome]
MTKKVLLKYSAEKAKEPILASIIKETDTLLNILHAKFSAEGGEILLAIDAPEAEVKRIIELFEQKGIETKELKRAIQLDAEKCFDCGACISLCPTGALRLTDDYSIELDEDKCIYCEICVPSCPVRALKVSKF